MSAREAVCPVHHDVFKLIDGRLDRIEIQLNRLVWTLISILLALVSGITWAGFEVVKARFTAPSGVVAHK